MKKVVISNEEVKVTVVMEEVDLKVEEVEDETPTIEVYTVPPVHNNHNHLTAKRH